MTRHSCRQSWMLRSNGVRSRLLSSARRASSRRQSRKLSRSCFSSCWRVVSVVHAGRRGILSPSRKSNCLRATFFSSASDRRNGLSSGLAPGPAMIRIFDRSALSAQDIAI